MFLIIGVLVIDDAAIIPTPTALEINWEKQAPLMNGISDRHVGASAAPHIPSATGRTNGTSMRETMAFFCFQVCRNDYKLKTILFICVDEKERTFSQNSHKNFGFHRTSTVNS